MIACAFVGCERCGELAENCRLVGGERACEWCVLESSGAWFATVVTSQDGPRAHEAAGAVPTQEGA